MPNVLNTETEEFIRRAYSKSIWEFFGDSIIRTDLAYPGVLFCSLIWDPYSSILVFYLFICLLVTHIT